MNLKKKTDPARGRQSRPSTGGGIGREMAKKLRNQGVANIITPKSSLFNAFTARSDGSVAYLIYGPLGPTDSD
ncbi:MAG: hypothetical protein CMH56_04430 [Myxococcales bacterium]|nr:hypothetical protein [Myxococcales bacterium]